MKIVKDTEKYQALLGTPAAEGAGLMTEDQARRQPKDAYILTGDKTRAYGGGQSPYGFIMLRERIIGRVRIDPAALARGSL